MSKYTVVLAEGPNGLGVIRSLHLKNISTIAVTLNNNDVSCSSRLPIENKIFEESDIQGDESLLVDYLLSLPYGSVVIPTSDRFVSFLSVNSSQLENNCLFIIPSVEITRLLIDKRAEMEFVKDIVDTPATITNLISPEQVLNELILPIIIKPRSHLHMVLGAKNICLYSASDVQDFFSKYHDKLDNLIAQSIITGKDDAQWVCNCVFDENSNIIQPFTFNRLKLAPSHFGVTSYAVSQFNQEVVELSSKLGKALNYVGPAMIEFKRDEKDGLYKYIEINPRLGMCNFFDTSCNVNNVFLTYLLSKQEKIQNIANLKMRSNVVFLSLFEDYFSRIKDGEGSLLILRNYLSNFNKKHVFIYFVWWDPKPALIIGWKQFKSIVMSFNKKLISYFKGK